jgi:hypothetical protein
VRYCGWYSHRSRGMRRLMEEPEDVITLELHIEDKRCSPFNRGDLLGSISRHYSPPPSQKCILSKSHALDWHWRRLSCAYSRR